MLPLVALLLCLNFAWWAKGQKELLQYWLNVLIKSQGNDQLREKVGRMHGTIERLEKQLGESRKKEDDAVGERVTLSKRLQDTEGQLTTTEILNEGLRKDKNRVITFIDLLSLT